MTLQDVKLLVGVVLIATSAAGAAFTSEALAEHVPATQGMAHGSRLVIPMMDPQRGKALFVSKGCVACHAINGVGGHDAPPMDAHRSMGLVNPFDFAARLWNHAPAMIAAQEGAMGEQIYFTGEELANIIAFLHNEETQHRFSEADLTPEARKMMHHDHGKKTAPAAHAKEIGHQHGEGEGRSRAAGMPAYKN